MQYPYSFVLRINIGSKAISQLNPQILPSLDFWQQIAKPGLFLRLAKLLNGNNLLQENLKKYLSSEVRERYAFGLWRCIIMRGSITSFETVESNFV